MRILVTGSAGHLGEALMRVLRSRGRDARGTDIKPSDFTDKVGSIVDRVFVREAMAGVDAVLHTATLHKPHVATHTRQDFIDTNITGTLNLLEEALAFVLAQPALRRERGERCEPPAYSTHTAACIQTRTCLTMYWKSSPFAANSMTR